MTSITIRSNGEVDSWPFMFTSGFVFGIALSLLFLAVVVAGMETGGVSVDAVVNTSASVTSIGGAVFGLILGAALYLLAFPENREWFESDAD
jgi:hypothetical protein